MATIIRTDGRGTDEPMGSGSSAATPGAAGTTLDTDLLTAGRVSVIGLGGIGSILATYLTMFLAALRDSTVRMLLIDGDAFEERNRERMDVPELGNKATAWCRVLLGKFGRPRLSIRPVDSFVRTDNVEQIISERDVCFACVDNHATRKLVSDRCQMLSDIVLISGGNDGVEGGQRGTYGNVQVFRRRGGVEMSPPLTRFHPEIREPSDKVPEVSCADLAATTAPQILFANLAAASAMLNALYRILRVDQKDPMYAEACFDILEAKMVPHWLGPTS